MTKMFFILFMIFFTTYNLSVFKQKKFLTIYIIALPIVKNVLETVSKNFHKIIPQVLTNDISFKVKTSLFRIRTRPNWFPQNY